MSFIGPQLRQAIRECMVDYRSSADPVGIRANAHFETLLRQLFDSVRRVEYFFALRARDISPHRSDPDSEEFDPIRAAIQHLRSNDLDEAAWLVFLSTHFGTNLRTGWRLVREVYGSLGTGARWNWDTTQSDLKQFLQWLSANHAKLKGRFGNHRKYVSLKPKARGGTGEAFESYTNWIQSYSSHPQLLTDFRQRVGIDRGVLFDALYEEMKRNVKGFARTGCFDYLCTLGKLDVFPIEPSSPYISGSTGPLRGAALLVSGSAATTLAPKDLDQQMQQLGNALAKIGVRFAMQVLEDALCNWQKSPSSYEQFHG